MSIRMEKRGRWTGGRRGNLSGSMGESDVFRMGVHRGEEECP